MQIFQGKIVSQGIAVGPVLIWQKKKFTTERRQITDVPAEMACLDAALEETKEQLRISQTGSTDVVAENPSSVGAIFEAQSMLLEDESFIGQVRELIRSEQVNAAYAVEQVGNKVSEMFAAMEDAYMREREADIRDITGRILQNLQGEEQVLPAMAEPSIILAEELTPGQRGHAA